MYAYSTNQLDPSPRRFRFGPRQEKPPVRRALKIGLALSGGGIKAVAHIGVLSALARAGLKFDMVAGTSAGALVGLFYCDGHDPASMSNVIQKELMGGWWWRCLPMGNFLRLARLLRGGGLKGIIQRHVKARCFEDLRTPFFTTSTDLVRGEAVMHERGEVAHALQASMSLPGLTPPVPDGDRLLADGGLLTYLPSQILKERGADIVIGVDLSGDAVKPGQPTGALSVLCRAWDVQDREAQRSQLAAVDVLIRPPMNDVSCADFGQMQNCFARGEEAGSAAIAKIRSLISNWAS